MSLKEQIITEALKQFSTKGFLGTSTMDIIEAVGTSKGGLYNHFKSKEQLFYEALSQARKIWRDRNLCGLRQIDDPIEKIKKILINYKDNYLADSDNFPGGCIFVNFAIELSDQKPVLAEAVNEGFDRFKAMLRRLLDQAKASQMLKAGVDNDQVIEMIFAGLLGACVMHTVNKSTQNLELTIHSLTNYLSSICKHRLQDN
ncbi:MAG: TetR/AcrR family transcriptional regulator [Desulfobacteraceae bacterium]|jgi:TetR/AcrR family transcriptional repressor of nem operon